MPHNQSKIENLDMLDSLGLQLREAEARRADVERAHKETLAQIRNFSVSGKCDNELIENLQSKARELEKKVALETVRCEELQLELSAAMKSKSARHCTSAPPTSTSSSVTWAPAINQDQNSEVELIMAKIEQDNRVLAELEEPRTSGAAMVSNSVLSMGNADYKPLSKNVMAGASVLTGFTIPTNTNSNTTNGMNASGGLLAPNSISASSNLSSNVIQSLNTSSYSGTSCVDKVLSGAAGMNVSSLSPNVYTLKHLPSLSQRGTIQLYNLQSTTMPILSLHNSHPAASSSYSLGLSGISVNSSYMHPNISNMIDTNAILGNGLNATTGTTGSSIYGLSSVIPGLQSTYSPPFIDSGAASLPYAGTIRNSKPKLLDDVDFSLMRYGNRSSPCSPIPPPSTWGFDDYTDGLNPNSVHSHRGLGLGSTLDIETRGHILNGSNEPQVDMLDIPGKGRCCVFIARFPYDPPEEAEGELSLSAGDYLLVWSGGDPHGGYLDAELLDGRRGLVPASFVQRLIGDDLLEFHQAVLSTLRDAEDGSLQCDATSMPSLPPNNPLLTHTQEDLARLSESQTELENESDIDDTVPAPKHLTLERQMNKSVLIGWSPGEPINYMNIECYHVYVDGVLKVTVKATDRTRALIEGVDSTRPHRISVRSVAQNRKTSRDAACTMIIGRDTSHLGPSAVRAGNITCSSALISWLPANSNHQHIICVNNVEVRVVKPGIYRHTITGLSPSTQYRVTVRAKHLRASGRVPPHGGRPTEEAPGAYADFRTLAKGLPDPPQDIQLEAGPQDGTILVTWQPVNRPSSSGPVTGYAVYADGKKVTDINSPTGDHALIDIGKLTGLNPRAVTIRTKSRDSQSADSAPILIPNIVRTAATRKGPVTIMTPGRVMGPISHQGEHEDQSMQGQPQQTEGGSGILGGLLGGLFSKNQSVNPHENGFHPAPTPRNTAQIRPNAPMNMQQQQMQQQQQQQQHQQQQQQHQQQQQQQQQQYNMQQGINQNRFVPVPGPRAPLNAQQQQTMQQQQQQKKPRYFIAMFDYDPSTMSPNPDGCEEELPFREGDTIRVYGDKDGDGFYWGELRGRRGYVPHNMVTEVDETQTSIGGTGSTSAPVSTAAATTTQSMRNISRDRWGDIYANTPVKRMIALYDYDPQELSPNVDAEQVELSFKTGEIILVYGDMDEDGFFMGELDGVRGLVPSNFLAEAPEQYNNQMISGGPNMAQRNLNNRVKGQGPGARGPPPPPRENVMPGAPNQRGPARKDAGHPRSFKNAISDTRPASPTLLDNTGHPAPDHPTQVRQGTGGMIGGGNNAAQHQFSTLQQQQDYENQQYQQLSQQQQQQQQQQQHQQQPPPVSQQSGGGLFSGATSLLSGATQAATGGLFGSKPKTDQNVPPTAAQPMQQQPQGYGGVFGGANQQQQQQQQHPQQQQSGQQQPGQGPGFMSKLNEMAAPGSDILSKAKDSFFGKFGFGK